MDILGHLKTITAHKKLVGQYCFKVGLIRQGIMHDFSKYSPTEFIVGCKYYQGTHSPHIAERMAKGYSSAWLHHKGRNKHHFEYWIDYSINKDEVLVGGQMPFNYVVEMVLDRIAASKIYNKENYTDASPLEYYTQSKSKCVIHKTTQKQLEILLTMLAQRGEKYTMRYLRKALFKYRVLRIKKYFRDHTGIKAAS